jgi:hypothetical protein
MEELQDNQKNLGLAVAQLTLLSFGLYKLRDRNDGELADIFDSLGNTLQDISLELRHVKNRLSEVRL